MRTIQRSLGILAASAALLTAGACQGSLLGNILGGGQQQQAQSGQLYGVVRSVDIRNQRIDIQDNSSGQTYWVQYDNRTQVVYRNQTLPPSSIRQGDTVNARVQNNGNNTYYTDYVQVS